MSGHLDIRKLLALLLLAACPEFPKPVGSCRFQSPVTHVSCGSSGTCLVCTEDHVCRFVTWDTCRSSEPK